MSNDRIAQVLNDATGQHLDTKPSTWRSWYVETLGYRTPSRRPTPRPTVVEQVPLNYRTQVTPILSGHTGWWLRFLAVSCFGAGTLVRTLDGLRPIEQIAAGDRVLTQDIQTGALGYQPVLVIHHNPPSPTFVVKVAGEEIVSSPFHRFWIAGEGWKMARELKAGDTLRLLGGVAAIEEVTEGPVQPVFNLDVATDHDFFAGGPAALVHDNTLPDLRLEPFDATAAVARAD